MITKFRGDYWFLSNFYPASFKFLGKTWPTSEHLYMAFKTTDLSLKEKIRNLETPGKAKRFGKKLKLRSDWEKMKESSMLLILREKFIQNPDIRKRLIDTGNEEIVEGNTWHDNIWGNCSCDKCSTIEGKNLLGILLMQVRTELSA